MPKLITLDLPDYQVDREPNYETIGRTVDNELRRHFAGRTIVARGIGSSEHPDKTIDELATIILTTGIDRYDASRAGDRYDNVQNKPIDLFGFRRTVTPRMQLFRDVVYGFYRSAISVHDHPTRINLLLIYDATQLKGVTHYYKGREQAKRDGFIFKNPTDKPAALLGLVKIL